MNKKIVVTVISLNLSNEIMQSSVEITDNLIKYLKKLPTDKWKVKVNNNWTVFDVVAHLAGWLDEVIKVLPDCWAKQTSPWFFNENDYSDDYAKFNAKQIKKYQKLTPKQLVDEYIRLNLVLDKIIDNIGINNLRKNNKFGWVLDEKETEDNHELHHIKQITKAVENN